MVMFLVPGIPGQSQSHDGHNEHVNLELTKIAQRSHGSLQQQQLERDVMASNVSAMMLALDRDVQQLPGAGGDHATRKMSADKVADLAQMFEDYQPFSKTRPKVSYNDQEMHCWMDGDGLNLPNTTRFVMRREGRYRISRNLRLY